jgi:hypothetical protein
MTQKRKPRLTIYYEHDHEPGCSALATVKRGQWTTPWWMPGEVVYRAKDGRRRKHGSRRFYVVQCNAHGCPARALVRETEICELVPPEPRR